MSSPPLTAALDQEAIERERFSIDRTPVVPDLNLTAMEQQFFVEWEVPQPDMASDAASPAR